MAIPIPGDVRQLLGAANYVHLSTLRADGSPRNWVVWAGLEDDHILACTSDTPVCFVIAVEKAAGRTLDFVHNPNRLTDTADHAPSDTPSASEPPGAHRA